MLAQHVERQIIVSQRLPGAFSHGPREPRAQLRSVKAQQTPLLADGADLGAQQIPLVQQPMASQFADDEQRSMLREQMLVQGASSVEGVQPGSDGPSMAGPCLRACANQLLAAAVVCAGAVGVDCQL